MLKEEKVCIIAFTDNGLAIAKTIQKEFYRSKLYTTRETAFSKDILKIENIDQLISEKFNRFDTWIFVGALGICVRSIALYIKDKTTDPAVINIDDQGRFVQSVLSGHLGGANEATKKISHILQAQAVITTSSDLQDLWALDLLPAKFNWDTAQKHSFNKAISLFVNNRPTAVVLKVKDAGAAYLEKTKPAFADIYYDVQQVDQSKYELLIYVGYEVIESEITTLSFYPKCLSLGSGCGKDIEADLFEDELLKQLYQNGIAYQSIKALTSVDIKADEQAYVAISKKYDWDFYYLYNRPVKPN